MSNLIHRDALQKAKFASKETKEENVSTYTQGWNDACDTLYEKTPDAKPGENEAWLKHRDFMSLTKEEVQEIVTDIFHANKVTCVTYQKRFRTITCKAYMDWDTTDEDGNPMTYEDAMVVELNDPFEEEGICADCSLRWEDQEKLRQYCFAKGIVPWIKDNPYIDHETETGSETSGYDEILKVINERMDHYNAPCSSDVMLKELAMLAWTVRKQKEKEKQ